MHLKRNCESFAMNDRRRYYKCNFGVVHEVSIEGYITLCNEYLIVAYVSPLLRGSVVTCMKCIYEHDHVLER